MKWEPATVISRWLGHARQYSRCGPVRIAPGSALTKSLGSGLDDSHVPYPSTIAVTSAGSPSIGISRGHVSVGRRDSPGSV